MNFFSKTIVMTAVFCSPLFAGENQQGFGVYSDREIAAYNATHFSRNARLNSLRQDLILFSTHKKRKINDISYTTTTTTELYSSSSDDHVYETSKSPTSLSSFSIEESSSHEEPKITVEKTSSGLTITAISFNSSNAMNTLLQQLEIAKQEKNFEITQLNNKVVEKTMQLTALQQEVTQLEAQHKNILSKSKNINVFENKFSAKEPLNAKRKLLSQYSCKTEQILKHYLHCVGNSLQQSYYVEEINNSPYFFYFCCCGCKTLEIITKEKAKEIKALRQSLICDQAPCVTNILQ